VIVFSSEQRFLEEEKRGRGRRGENSKLSSSPLPSSSSPSRFLN
jgi:hypothetical protein